LMTLSEAQALQPLRAGGYALSILKQTNHRFSKDKIALPNLFIK